MLYDNSMFKCNILVKKKKSNKKKKISFRHKKYIIFYNKIMK